MQAARVEVGEEGASRSRPDPAPAAPPRSSSPRAPDSRRAVSSAPGGRSGCRFQRLSHPPPVTENKALLETGSAAGFLQPRPPATAEPRRPHAHGPTQARARRPAAPATQGPLLPSDAGDAAPHWPAVHERPPPGSGGAASSPPTSGVDASAGPSAGAASGGCQPARSGAGEPCCREAGVREAASPSVHRPQPRGGPRRWLPRKRKRGRGGVSSSASSARRRSSRPPVASRAARRRCRRRRPHHAVSRFSGRRAADEQAAGEVGRPPFPGAPPVPPTLPLRGPAALPPLPPGPDAPLVGPSVGPEAARGPRSPPPRVSSPE